VCLPKFAPDTIQLLIKELFPGEGDLRAENHRRFAPERSGVDFSSASFSDSPLDSIALSVLWLSLTEGGSASFLDFCLLRLLVQRRIHHL
jgi:hypothetical protein